MNAKKQLIHLHKAGHDPRAAALVAISRTLYEGVDSQAALDGVLAPAGHVPTDKRLCTEIVYGVLRWYLRLKEFSEHYLTRPDKLPDEMRVCLLAALYEMAFLRVPHHGPVNWAVGHVRNRFGKDLSGVANGALRSMQRDLPDFFSAADEPFATRYAMPEWIVRLWSEHYGDVNTLAMLEASQAAPPSGLRLNRAVDGWESLRLGLIRENEGSMHPVGPAGLAFSGSLPWHAKTLLKEGKASRQSAASYEALEAFDPDSWPGPVWDCCAGRGGKTMALLEQGVLVALASDPSSRRLDELPREYARLGLSTLPCPQLAALSAEAAAALLLSTGGEHLAPGGVPPQSFGTILVDAPCSGLGTLARRPEIRLRRTPEDLETMAATQKAILEAVWPRLRSGGCLVYLTCTFNPAENEQQIEAFTRSHPDAVNVREFRTPFDSPLHEFFYGALLEKR